MIQMALAMASLCQYAAKEEVFGVNLTPSEKEVQPRRICEVRPKQLHEFVIKGEKIMATSRKDAIKRYNHKYR